MNFFKKLWQICTKKHDDWQVIDIPFYATYSFLDELRKFLPQNTNMRLVYSSKGNYDSHRPIFEDVIIEDVVEKKMLDVMRGDEKLSFSIHFKDFTAARVKKAGTSGDVPWDDLPFFQSFFLYTKAKVILADYESGPMFDKKFADNLGKKFSLLIKKYKKKDEIKLQKYRAENK